MSNNNEVTLTIDEVEITVPKGTLVVDAAKRIGNDIPVFCYHPKMKPVGMCRMCLVEIGLPIRDRQTGEIQRDEQGNIQYNFGKGLQTGCTVPVSEGMLVRTNTEQVDVAREDILEFLLTSHPLDCPICDKGGECPLQNLTMRHGPGTSRMNYYDKMKLAKHVPLGELIYLDRERCIQCARCTRFQEEIVDDAVIGFHNRGRRLEIITFSDPGFDSYWSGNTTDICPVGALTAADFRFEARPWELSPVASICHHCPVGCNLTMDIRRQPRANGRQTIQRIMPRQNEQVNEIWICDKGRFVHHYADAPDRLQQPLVRKNGQLVETDWDEALGLVLERLRAASGAVAGIAGDRLSNEDLYLFQKLIRQGLGSNHLALANPRAAGGDVVAKVGISSDSNLLELGEGDAIVVAASDLHEEAPVWWLRVKQAAERGAKLVLLNLRPTRLDKFASHTLYYLPGMALDTVRQFVNAAKVQIEAGDDPLQQAAQVVAEAQNLVIFYGHEGLTYSETDALARLLANLLLVKGADGQSRAGKVNNGLVPVWPHGNTQGAWDMGIHPRFGPGYRLLDEPGLDPPDLYQAIAGGQIQALYIAGADPVGDGLMVGRDGVDFLVVQELFLTETAALADVVLPAQSWAEREGSFTNGERRVQRYYPAIPVVGLSRPDWQIFAALGAEFGLGKIPFAASLVFREIAAEVSQYAGLDYRKLAHVEEQWPSVGGSDLYYGGTSYRNRSGLGVQWPVAAEGGEPVELFEVPEPHRTEARSSRQQTAGDSVSAGASGRLPLIAIRALYAPGTLIERTEMLEERRARPTVILHEEDASQFGVSDGDRVSVTFDGPSRTRDSFEAAARVTPGGVPGLALLRGTGYPFAGSGPAMTPATIRKEEEKELA